MKRVLKFLCPLFFALGILFLPCFSSNVSASEKTEITDTLKNKIREFIDSTVSDNPRCNAYIVFWDSDGNLCVSVLRAPSVVELGRFFANCYGFKCYYSSDADNNSPALTYCWKASGTGSFKLLVSSTSNIGSGNCTYVIGGADNLWNNNDMSDTIAYANFDFKSSDGTVFFTRRSLVVSPVLKTNEGAELQTKTAKTAKVIVTIAVSSVLLFPLLAIFIKKSLTSLVK